MSSATFAVRCQVKTWPVSHLLLAGLSAVAVSLIARPAVADEAYLCGPDSVIYVSAADLPNMKRTNACIAAYYGLKVEETGTKALSPKAAPKPVSAAAKAKPIADVRAQAVVQSALKPQIAPEPSTRAASVPMRQASLAPVSAAPGTDFRNVRILNATSDDAAVFHHTK